MLISLSLSSNPTHRLKQHGLEELVGRGGVQRMNQVGEHKRHQHQDVRDPLINRRSCRERRIADVNHRTNSGHNNVEENQMQVSCSVVHPTSSTQRKCIINQLMLQESRLYREKLYIHMADAPKIYIVQ